MPISTADLKRVIADLEQAWKTPIGDQALITARAELASRELPTNQTEAWNMSVEVDRD